MFVAIVASLITLVVLAIVVIVVLVLRSNRKSTHVTPKRSHNIKKIDTVGVSSSLKQKGSSASHASAAREQSAGTAKSLRTRFTVVGAFAAATFAALAAKVGSMQLFSSTEYEREAAENLYRTVSTPAPRGLIYDADGVALVQNKSSLTVLAEADVADDRDTVQRLSALLGIPHNIVRQRIQDTSGGAQSLRVVAENVTLRSIAFIAEHPEAFEGVTTETRMIREYPYGALAAHVLGYTGPITEEALASETKGVEHELGDTIGQSGVEAYYESVLAGTHGSRVVIADADGAVREVKSEVEASKGNDLYLTIRTPIQKVADKALAALVAPEGVLGAGKGTAASLVCIDVRDGGIAALANYPTFTPESFIGGITSDVWDAYNTADSRYPLLNRAIAGEYPAASTFKAFTGMAGLEYGFAEKKEKEDPEKTWNCAGTWTGFGVEYPQKCWDTYGHGTLSFRTGVVVSCDVVFYEIAKDFYEARNDIGDTAMQDFIRKYGFASETGVDLGGEAVGRLPTPAWKAERFKDVPEEKEWRPGDLSNMSIGQGYVAVTPIQMAVGYAAIATGKILKPHVLKEVKNSDGDSVLTKGEEVASVPDVSEDHLNVMRDALHGVSNEDSAVSRQFNKYGIDGASKTGTAEVEGKGDFAWFACYAPYDNPQYVVACVVEEGGAGAEAACPVSVEVLAAALEYEAGTIDRGLEYIPGSLGVTVDTSGISISSGRTD